MASPGRNSLLRAGKAPEAKHQNTETYYYCNTHSCPIYEPLAGVLDWTEVLLPPVPSVAWDPMSSQQVWQAIRALAACVYLSYLVCQVRNSRSCHRLGDARSLLRNATICPCSHSIAGEWGSPFGWRSLPHGGVCWLGGQGTKGPREKL